jgi:hypothetical protein
MNMFVMFYVERPRSLTNIFQWAIQAFQLIYAAIVIFIYLFVMF